MAEFLQKTVLILEARDFKQLFWSVPFWEALGDPSNDANKGIVRHGGLKQMVDHVPRDFKLPYPKHVQAYLNSIQDPEGQGLHALLAWGTRNAYQNLGLPAYHAMRRPKLLRRPDEPWQSWVYHAFCKFTDGTLGMAAVKFKSRAGDGDPDRVVFIGNDQKLEKEMEWAVTGQPLLWDGEVPPLALLAACTYDLRHVWHLQWEAWQACEKDWAIHTELMDAFMKHLHGPIQKRAEALSGVAAWHGLPVTDAYLHSSIGVTHSGDPVLLMKHGSLTDLGYAHKLLGSKRAILLDNGGSVGVAYWSKRDWQASGWPRIKDNPISVGNGSYFRPRGHAVLIAELKEDLVDRPFARRASGRDPWQLIPSDQ